MNQFVEIGKVFDVYPDAIVILAKNPKGDEYRLPIIKSNNFGHIDKKTVIPIGIRARIDTSKDRKIELLENCVK